MKTRLAILATALAAATLPALPVAAAGQQGRASVSYDDLDLSSEAGRAELGNRFEKAAREMCGVTDPDDMHGKERYCYERTNKQLKVRVAQIISEHEATKGG